MNRDSNRKERLLAGILNMIILLVIVFIFLGFVFTNYYFSVFLEQVVKPYWLLELLAMVLVVRVLVAVLPPKARIINNQIQIKHLIPLINRTVDPEEIVAVQFANQTKRGIELEEEYYYVNSIPQHELEEFAQKHQIPVNHKFRRG